MAEERDPEVSAAYRGLGAEAPPRALDDAILAASRRPLAKPWTQRWAVPLSLAAVLVLSVAVTLRIQHEQPGIESAAPVAREVVRETAQTATSSPAAEARPSTPAEPPARPAPRKVPAPFPAASQDKTAVAAEPPAPAEVPAPRADTARGVASSVAGARMSEERMVRDAETATAPALAKRSAPMAASAPAAPGAAGPETPERELERIAGLRRDAKHDEADRALAEFRKRYPDFKIAAPMLERVERR